MLLINVLFAVIIITFLQLIIRLDVAQITILGVLLLVLDVFNANQSIIVKDVIFLTNVQFVNQIIYLFLIRHQVVV